MWKFLSWPNALIALGSLLAAWANFWFTSKRKQRLREGLVLIGVGISAAGGVWTSSQQAAYEEQITGMTSGGDSFCYGSLLFPSDDQTNPELAVWLEGKFPLQNVHVIVRDIDRLRAALPNIPEGKENARIPTSAELTAFNKLSTSFDIPFLGPPGSAVRVRGLKLPENVERITYEILFQTPFQKFEQDTKLRKVNGTWKQAYRVYKSQSGEKGLVLREHVDRGFPPDQGGKVNWDYLPNY